MNPPIVLPADWLSLYKVIANPITFGILLSMILAQLKFMGKDSTFNNGKPVSDSLKMLIVILSCLVWAVIITLLSPDGFVLNSASVYGILLLTFSVAFSSQIWHTVVSPFIAQIIAILFGAAQILVARARALALANPNLTKSDFPLLPEN